MAFWATRMTLRQRNSDSLTKAIKVYAERGEEGMLAGQFCESTFWKGWIFRTAGCRAESLRHVRTIETAAPGWPVDR